MPAPVLQFKRGAFANLPGLRAGEPGFTTDKYDLYVGLTSSVATNKFFGSSRYWTRETASSGSGINFVENTTGTDYITLRAPSNLSGIGTYTLPDTNTIVDGYFLKVASNGTLSWDTVASVSGGTLTNTSLTGITTIGGTFFDVNVGADFSGITTFSNTTDNTLGNTNTGAVQIDGGLGVDKNVSIGAGLSVTGQSYFIGTATFYGGSITLGDNVSDSISVGGRFASNLVPTTDNTYDVGISTLNWRNAHFSGIGTFETGAIIDGVQIGINGANVIDTVSGNLTLNSAGGTTIIDDAVTIQNNLTVNGSVTVGGTTVTLRGQDVFIENRDIVLGYTTSTSPSDTSANHGGLAIASTEGTPLTSFTASGVNTLPDTYKQLMWFKSGTLGFSTDMFAFNYGVAIGTTNVANGVRFAVGSGITMSDTAITASNFYGTFNGTVNGTIVGVASTATRSLTVDTTTAPNGTFYPGLFVNSTGTASTAVYVDAGISYVSNTDTLALTGDIAVNGGDVTTSASTFNLVNANATTVNFAGAATELLLGNTTGITTVRNKLTVGGNLEVDGNNIQASDGNTNITLTSNTLTTFAGDIRVNGNDIQASDGNANITMTSNTLTAFAGDVRINGNDIQSSTGTVAISLSGSDATVAGDLAINGGDLTTSATTFNLLNATATSLNFGGAATSLVVGATTGVTTVRNSLRAGNAGVAITQFSSTVFSGIGSTTQSPTSSAVIDYVGSQLGNVDLTLGLTADSGGPSTVNTSQTLTISGTASEVETSVSGQTVTVGLPNAVVVGTSLSAPTLRTATVQSQTGTNALTIATNGNVTASTQLTIGSGIGITQFSGTLSGAANSTTTAPSSSAVIDYVGTQLSNVDLTLGINADTGGASTVNTSQTLTISGTTSEVETSVSGQTITVGLPNAVIVGTSLSAPTLRTATIQSQTGSNALTIASNGSVTTVNNLTVSGDLFVNGNTTEVNTTSLNVYDRTITLGLQTGATPTTTTWDLGILMNYGDAGVAKTAGVVWDYATRRFRFGIDTDNPASSSTTTPQIGITTYASIEVAGLWINNACSGGAQEVIGCVGAELQLQNIVVDGGVF